MSPTKTRLTQLAVALGLLALGFAGGYAWMTRTSDTTPPPARASQIKHARCCTGTTPWRRSSDSTSRANLRSWIWSCCPNTQMRP